MATSTILDDLPDRRAFADLTEKQQKFCMLVADGVPRAEAYEQAGYQASPKSLAANARKLHRQLREHIEQLVKERIDSGAPACIGIVMKLAESANSEQVRFNAAKYIIALAGFEQPQRIEVTEVGDKTTEDLQKELRAILGASADVIWGNAGGSAIKH